MFGRVFSAIWNLGISEFDRLRWAMGSILLATVLPVIFLVHLRTPLEKCFWIIVPCWIFSLYRLFSMTTLLKVHAAGEFSEFLEELGRGLKKMRSEAVTSGTEIVQAGTGVFRNEFSDDYLEILKNICFLQTGLFLALPLYIRYTVGGLGPVVILMMLSVVCMIASMDFFRNLCKVSIVGISLLWTVGLSGYLFPQFGFYKNYLAGDAVRVVPQSSAQIVNQITAVKDAQIEQRDNAVLQRGLDWQKTHPAEELPQQYREKVREVATVVDLERFSKKQPQVENKHSRSCDSGFTQEQKERMYEKIYGKN